MTDIYFLVLLMEFTRALDMEIEKKNGFRFFHRDLAIRKRQNLLPDPPVSQPAGKEISRLQMAKTRRRKKNDMQFLFRLPNHDLA